MSTTERIVGRPWDAHEDNLLKKAVAIHGENDNWKTVALHVPGRTNKACRKRWLHSLSPTVKKSAWTPDEDRLLLELYSIHSIKWSVIARHIPGRTDDACSKRYREALDPSLKKDEWTPDEDNQLWAIYARIGGKWGQVGQELSRSGLGCRNRWRLLERKRLAAVSNQSSPAHHALVDQFASPKEDTPQNDWSPMSMLDVARYWADEETDTTRTTTLASGHLPSYVRTQGMELVLMSQNAGPSGVSNEMQGLNALSPPFYNSYSFNTALSATRASQTPQLPYHNSSITTDSFDSVQDHTVTPTSNSHLPLRINGPPLDDDMNNEYHQMTAPLESDLSQNVLGAIDNPVVVYNSRPSPDPQAPPAPIDSRPHSPARDTGLDTTTASSNNQLPPQDASPSSRSDSPRYSPYYRPVAQTPQSSIRKGRTVSGNPLRLNSDLSVTNDVTIRPYSCGHRQCWPTDLTTSSACYGTSRELNDHNKKNHMDDILGGGKPFRCGLSGCGKAWKSINGLQYHLQISKAHFQQALSSVTRPISVGPNEAQSEAKNKPVTNPKNKKVHPCPHTNCSNQYKQLSGLRYHLAHGHPDPHDIPMQLDVVPPTLARKVAEKLSSRCPPAST